MLIMFANGATTLYSNFNEDDNSLMDGIGLEKGSVLLINDYCKLSPDLLEISLCKPIGDRSLYWVKSKDVTINTMNNQGMNTQGLLGATPMFADVVAEGVIFCRKLMQAANEPGVEVDIQARKKILEFEEWLLQLEKQQPVAVKPIVGVSIGSFMREVDQP